MRIRILSVTEVTQYLKRILGGDPILSHISIQGEISNLKIHSSGHLYFTLKDDGARMQCVMFQGDAGGLQFLPADGMSVVAKGQVTVYEREGRYQLYVRQMETAGLGDLHARFEALKARLESQGYFSQERKKRIPMHAAAVGVVTSADSAAWRDIQAVLARRNDAVRVYLCHASVQGVSAAAELSNALQTLDAMGLDVLILARGGGSIEELWAFNEELLATTLRQLKTPVICGVGHETDFTIADFTADLRAATPTAAAELAVSEKRYQKQLMGQAVKRMSEAMLRKIAEGRRVLDRAEPARLSLGLVHDLEVRRRVLEERLARHTEQLSTSLLQREHDARLMAQRLDGASPLRILDRGYALVTEPGGRRIGSVNEASPGKQLNVQLKDGTFKCRVETDVQGER